MTYTLVDQSRLANPSTLVETYVGSAAGTRILLRVDNGSVRQDLERHIHLRTGRRIRNLIVEMQDERIVLHGLADSYYIKQLAQEGVLGLIPDARLHNAISVDRPAEMIL